MSTSDRVLLLLNHFAEEGLVPYELTTVFWQFLCRNEIEKNWLGVFSDLSIIDHQFLLSHFQCKRFPAGKVFTMSSITDKNRALIHGSLGFYSLRSFLNGKIAEPDVKQAFHQFSRYLMQNQKERIKRSDENPLVDESSDEIEIEATPYQPMTSAHALPSNQDFSEAASPITSRELVKGGLIRGSVGTLNDIELENMLESVDTGANELGFFMQSNCWGIKEFLGPVASHSFVGPASIEKIKRKLDQNESCTLISHKASFVLEVNEEALANFKSQVIFYENFDATRAQIHKLLKTDSEKLVIRLQPFTNFKKMNRLSVAWAPEDLKRKIIVLVEGEITVESF